MAPSSPDAGPSRAGSDEGAQGPEEKSSGASQAAPATQSTRKDPLTRKASMLVEVLLDKYTKKEPVSQHALLKVIGRKYRQHFPEILRRASKAHGAGIWPGADGSLPKQEHLRTHLQAQPRRR